MHTRVHLDIHKPFLRVDGISRWFKGDTGRDDDDTFISFPSAHHSLPSPNPKTKCARKSANFQLQTPPGADTKRVCVAMLPLSPANFLV